MQNVSLVPTNDINAFVDALVQYEAADRPTIISPSIVTLDGKKGTWNVRQYNQEKRQSEVVPFGLPPHVEFKGTVMLVRYFAQWKYNPSEEKVFFRTNEFSNFGTDPVVLTRYDYASKENREKEIGRYESYQDFKEAHTKVDPVSNKTTSPYDLWVSLYVHVPSLDQTVNVHFRGLSRGTFFDYLKEYKTEDVRHMVQVNTVFGSRQDKNEAGIEYFVATFKNAEKNTEQEMGKIMATFAWLKGWMMNQKNVVAISVDEEGAPPTDVPALPSTDQALKSKIMYLLKKLGETPKTAEEAQTLVLTLTDCVLSPENYNTIVERLEIKVEGMPEEPRLEDIPF